MKKQLLIGSALFTAISAFSQSHRIVGRPATCTNIAEKIAQRFAIDETTPISSNLKTMVGPVQNSVNESQQEASVSMPPSTINWKLLCGSFNIFGMLVSSTKCLQYNDNLNAVSFIHRKSASYTPSPAIPTNAAAGVIVAEVTTDWGTTWDSTCIWSDATHWGRYPQGGIYNPPNNTNISNAYVVGMGPTTSASTWQGNFYASKQLNTFDNVASTAPNAQQFLSFGLASYPANQGPHGWSRQGFNATDDGLVRSLALIQDDNTGLTTMRGVSVVKGSFNAGAFVWTTDSLIPATIIKGDGSKVINSGPQMVWNESGSHGYVVILGAAAGATNSNKGFQPIIYKTSNFGTSWSLLPGIDFNSPAMSVVTDHIASINSNTNLAIPFFLDFDLAIDEHNDLHIAATCGTGFSDHNDSLGFIGQYTMSINPGINYNWGHVPGNRPYLYDFIGNGTSAWKVVTVDSLWSEAASAQTGQDGFADNPWLPTVTSEPVKGDNVDSRIQLGRTPSGDYITFSWAESDTNFTNGSRKFNNLPNVKTRLMSIGTGSTMYKVSATEINTTKVAAGTGTANPNVSSRATLHHLSPTTGSATVTFGPSGFPLVDIYTPITVTNSNPYDPSTNNATWYQSGKLSYDFNNLGVGIKEETQNSAANSYVYPNPASNNATLAIDLKNNSNVDITVMNMIGQVVKVKNMQGQVGDNKLNIDLNGLSSGIYMVNVQVGKASSTKKLIVQ